MYSYSFFFPIPTFWLSPDIRSMFRCPVRNAPGGSFSSRVEISSFLRIIREEDSDESWLTIAKFCSGVKLAGTRSLLPAILLNVTSMSFRNMNNRLLVA